VEFWALLPRGGWDSNSHRAARGEDSSDRLERRKCVHTVRASVWLPSSAECSAVRQCERQCVAVRAAVCSSALGNSSSVWQCARGCASV
jgi:hypothetical protein